MKTKSVKISFIVILALIVSLSLASCFLIEMPCTHDWEDATCQSPKICRLCGAESGTAIDHSYTPNVVAPTCTEDGYTVYTCSYCKHKYTDDEQNALGHKEYAVFEIQPTETVNGLKHIKCEVCGVVIEANIVVPAHIHEYTSKTVAPTCGEMGYTEYVCQCSYSYKDSFTPAVGHNYSGEFISLGNGTHKQLCLNDSAHADISVCGGGTAPADSSPGICGSCGGEYLFLAADGNISYGFRWLGENYTNGVDYQRLYIDLWECAESLADSNDNISADADGYYGIGTFDFEDYSLTREEAIGVWKIFYMDNPSYYWILNNALTSEKSLYLVIDEAYASASVRSSCDSMLDDVIEECGTYIEEGMTELERSMAIVEYIVTELEYARDENGEPEDAFWAHNLMGLAQYGSGVCETYAKSFVYLCTVYDIECIIATGYSDNELHAWNYVSIDGVWYGVDVTWTDKSGSDVYYDKFGMSDSFIHEDHTLFTSDTPGVNYHYDIPELSDTTMELVSVYKNGSYDGMYTNLDNAIASMTDLAAEYEVYLGYYSNYVGHVDHSISITSLPNVAKITLTGINTPASQSGYYDNNTALVLEGELKLGCDLVLKDLDITGGGAINVAGYELSLEGDCVYIDAEIYGESPSQITVDLLDTALFKGGIDIYKIQSVSGTIVFCEDSTIEYMNGKYYQTGDPQIDIAHRS